MMFAVLLALATALSRVSASVPVPVRIQHEHAVVTDTGGHPAVSEPQQLADKACPGDCSLNGECTLCSFPVVPFSCSCDQVQSGFMLPNDGMPSRAPPPPICRCGGRVPLRHALER